MATKKVLDRHLQAEHIAETAIQRAVVIAQALDDDGLDWEAVQTHVGRRLHAASDRYLEAANALERHQHETRSLRKERHEATRVLRDHVLTLRKVVTAAHGRSAALMLLGLQGDTPRSPARLAERAREMIHRLRDPALEPVSTPSPGFSLDRKRLATDLETSLRPLEERITVVRRARAIETSLLQARHRAEERFWRLRKGMALVIEGLYVSAGLPQLVPGIRRPGASVQDAPRRRSESVEASPQELQDGVELPETPVQALHGGSELPEAALQVLQGGVESVATPVQALHNEAESVSPSLQLLQSPSEEGEADVQRVAGRRKVG